MSQDNFDTERYIEVIRDRPCLWDVNSDVYANKTLKKKCWNEVFSIMIPEFENFSSKLKERESIHLRRRWKSLRNSFSRELARQKNIKFGSGISNRKQYVYFDMLSFLMPTMSPKTTRPTSSLHQDEDEEESKPTVTASADGLPEQKIQSRKRRAETENEFNNLNLKKTLIESLNNRYRTGDDEDDKDDRLFLLSLHSHLKSIRFDQKLFAKLEILQVLAKYNKPTSIPFVHFPTQNMPNPPQPSTSSQRFPPISFQNYQLPHQTVTNLPPSVNFPVITPKNQTSTTSTVDSITDSDNSSNHSLYSPDS